MKLTIINGNVRHGSTWHCKDLLVQALRKKQAVEVTEFSMPKDLPNMCSGCFSCFYNGESTCPHAAAVAPIYQAILDADVLVLTSPVYAMDVSSGMKSLLDHLCFLWMSHRPQPAMFRKIGVTIATTAGAGLGHATKTMHNSLKFWGVKRIFSFKTPISAVSWQELAEPKKLVIQKQTTRLAQKIVRSASRIEKLSSPLFRSVFFKMMSGMMAKNTWNPRDRQHWENQGWIPVKRAI